MKNTIIIAAIVFLSISTWAQQSAPPDSGAQNSATEQRIRELEDRVIALEGKLRAIETAQASQPQPAASGTAPEAAAQSPSVVAPAPSAPPNAAPGLTANPEQLPVYGGSSAASKALNPDISVIGDFIGAAGGNTPPPGATLQPFP